MHRLHMTRRIAAVVLADFVYRMASGGDVPAPVDVKPVDFPSRAESLDKVGSITLPWSPRLALAATTP